MAMKRGKRRKRKENACDCGKKERGRWEGGIRQGKDGRGGVKLKEPRPAARPFLSRTPHRLWKPDSLFPLRLLTLHYSTRNAETN